MIGLDACRALGLPPDATTADAEALLGMTGAEILALPQTEQHALFVRQPLLVAGILAGTLSPADMETWRRRTPPDAQAALLRSASQVAGHDFVVLDALPPMERAEFLLRAFSGIDPAKLEALDPEARARFRALVGAGVLPEEAWRQVVGAAPTLPVMQ